MNRRRWIVTVERVGPERDDGTREVIVQAKDLRAPLAPVAFAVRMDPAGCAASQLRHVEQTRISRHARAARERLPVVLSALAAQLELALPSGETLTHKRDAADRYPRDRQLRITGT